MNLPENGRVVIVDNKLDEALPLMKILSKSGFPFVFFNGKLGELPPEPIPAIRILFLDMVLLDAEENEPKIITGYVKSVLDKLLSKDNGPFIPIVWTKLEDYINELKDYLGSRGFNFPIIPLLKNDCRAEGTGDFDLDLIIKTLSNAMKGNEIVEFFITWENITHQAAAKTVYDVSQLKSFKAANWNDEMKTIVLKLAKSYVGKQVDEKVPNDVIHNSFFSLNGPFADNLYSIIRNDKKTNIQLKFDGISDTADNDTNGTINSKFNITEINDCKDLPGSVYANSYIDKVNPQGIFAESEEKNGDVITKITYNMHRKELEEASQIVLEVTPICDYAQRKMKVHRLIPGIMWPATLGNNIRKNALYLYFSPIIKFSDGKLYHLIFDFRYFTSIPLSKFNNSDYRFRIKQELLTDIQSKLSNHINRPGVVSLD